MYRQLIFTVLLLGITIFANAQNRINITITDATSGKPVEYAHVQLKPIPKGKVLFSITDISGKVSFNHTGRSELSVSFLGYETFHDTITGQSNINVQLKPGSVTINDVIITGHAGPVKADKSIYSVKVLDLKREEGKAAADLYQLLSTESNIRLQQDMYIGGKMTMQGLSGEYIKILIDGVPVTGRMDGNIDITQINMSNVDHIEIIEGPLSVIYGSGALAGTINIITKEKKQNGINLDVSTYGESVGITNSDISFKYKKNRSSFGISGMGYYFNGWDNSDTLYRTKQWKQKIKYNVSGHYMYSIKKLRLKASTTLFNEKVLDKGEPFGDRNQNAFDYNYITRRIDFKTEGYHYINDRYKVDVSFAYNFYQRLNETTFLDFDNNTSVHTGTDSTRFDQITSRMIYTAERNEKLNYSAGFDILWEKYSGDRVLGGVKDISDYAAFATLNYKPFSRIEIQPGIRAMYNTKYTAPVIYSFNLLYTPAKIWKNRFSYSRGFKSPDLKQLYLDFVLPQISITGNPDLDAEDSYNINFNSTVNFAKPKIFYSLSVKAFFNQLNNKIELVSVNNNEMSYTYININQVRTAGYGFDFNFKNHPHYSVTLSWTTTGLWNSFGYKYDAPDKYTWFTDITSTFNYHLIKPGIDVSINYKFNGKAPQYILVDDKPGLFERDKYNMLDFSTSKSLLKNRLKIMGGIKNIFNITDVKQTLNGNNYISLRGSDIIAYGRSFFIKLSYSL